jgi:hypothetical protein
VTEAFLDLTIRLQNALKVRERLVALLEDLAVRWGDDAEPRAAVPGARRGPSATPGPCGDGPPNAPTTRRRDEDH